MSQKMTSQSSFQASSPTNKSIRKREEKKIKMWINWVHLDYQKTMVQNINTDNLVNIYKYFLLNFSIPQFLIVMFASENSLFADFDLLMCIKCFFVIFVVLKLIDIVLC